MYLYTLQDQVPGLSEMYVKGKALVIPAMFTFLAVFPKLTDVLTTMEAWTVDGNEWQIEMYEIYYSILIQMISFLFGDF